MFDRLGIYVRNYLYVQSPKTNKVFNMERRWNLEVY